MGKIEKQMKRIDEAIDEAINEAIERNLINRFDEYADSFKEKMDEFIEMDELFEPFTVKNKVDHELDFEMALQTKMGYTVFSILFEYLYGFGLDVLCNDFIAPHIVVIDNSLFELDTVGLQKKGRGTFTFIPTSRLGRFIVFLAMAMNEDMKTHKEE